MNFKILIAIAAICILGAWAKPNSDLPPDFFNWIPDDAKAKLKEIHEDHSLKWEERKKMIDDVFDSLPTEVLKKMPLRPGYDKLPQKVKDQLQAIQLDKSIPWGQKREKMHEIIASLPEDQLKLLPPPRFGGPSPFGPRGLPPHPPTAFKEVLPSEVYQKLVTIHQDKNATEEEKKARIDETLKGVGKETLHKLPLPPNFDKLPAEAQQKAREILSDLSKDFDTRHQNLREFINTLTDDQKKLLRPHWGGFGPFGPRHHRGGFLPPHPPKEFKEILGEEIFNKLDEIHQLNVSREERFKKMDEIMSKIPKETLDKLPLPPPFRRLPEAAQAKIREIMRDFSIDASKRFAKVREFIKTLPEDQQKLLPPPPPSASH